MMNFSTVFVLLQLGQMNVDLAKKLLVSRIYSNR